MALVSDLKRVQCRGSALGPGADVPASHLSVLGPFLALFLPPAPYAADPGEWTLLSHVDGSSGS